MHAISETAVAGAAFRDAMSFVAGAVHVIATGGKMGLGGATATAVTSVTDAPPSLLVCLNETSATLEKIRQNQSFSVNVLAATQENVAAVFSGQGGFEGERRFRDGDGWIMRDGLPRLEGALASFACSLTDLKTVGSHIIMIGTVNRVWTGADVAPLLYFRRSYRAL
jgi:flavin reductase (DIM6/NTAB) family NADH-FMN oxidoreductase RutF